MSEGERRAAGYRAHLDGLRAVAVYLVVAFHAGVGRLAGGFIGVDVFFVLSGYLVTQLLLRDLDGAGGTGRGSVDLARFYSRRFRRLLPAAMVTILATVVIYGAIATPADLDAAKGSIQAASLWFANWYFVVRSTDYFAQDALASPVLHFWSLSIEEQFYLAWPLLLGGLFRLARGRAVPRRTVQATVAVAAIASVTAALAIAGSDLGRAYYGTDTRAYQLLAGALLALTPGIVARAGRVADARGRAVGEVVTGLALVGLLVLGTSWIDVGPIGRGVLAAVVAVVLIVGLEAAPSVARTVLSTGPARALGRVSYGTYLWHWIVILVLQDRYDLSPLATFGAAAVVATLLATASFHLLELPIRTAPRLDGWRRPTIALGLATSVLVGLVAVPVLVDRGTTRETASGSAAAGRTPITDALDWRAAAKDHRKIVRCDPADVAACTLVDGGAPKVLLLGDSNAAMYRPAFEALATERGFELVGALAPGCLWVDRVVRNDNTETVGTMGLTPADICRSDQRDWFDRTVPAVDPDVIVVVHRALDDPVDPVALVDDDGPLELDDAAGIDAFEEHARSALDALLATGAKVVIVEPAPATDEEGDQVRCLSEAAYVEDCAFDANAEPTPIETLYRRLADEDPDVWSIDMDQAQCPALPRCDAVIDGRIARWSPDHLTETFARTLADAFGEQLDAAGVLS